MNNPMGNGDGWVMCRRGHRHWGRFGAAGLLVRDGTRVILQHRAPWTHEGDAWGIPGGARDSHEDAVTAALREAFEEAALDPAAIRPTGLWVDDHGGWSYTSVLAEALAELRPYGANAESTDVTWIDDAAVESLTLHRGFAQTWPSLRRPPTGSVLVLGPRIAPLGSGDPLAQQLARFGVQGPLEPSPAGRRRGDDATILPQVVVLTDSAPTTGSDLGDVTRSPWWQRSISAYRPTEPRVGAALNEALAAGKTVCGVDDGQLDSWLATQSESIRRSVARISPDHLLAISRATV